MQKSKGTLVKQVKVAKTCIGSSIWIYENGIGIRYDDPDGKSHWSGVGGAPYGCAPAKKIEVFPKNAVRIMEEVKWNDKIIYI